MADLHMVGVLSMTRQNNQSKIPGFFKNFPVSSLNESLRFGWTRDTFRRNDEAYSIKLRQNDLVESDAFSLPLEGQYQFPLDQASRKPGDTIPQKIFRLKPAALNRVVNALGRESLEKPGFFVIKDIGKLFDNPRQMELFFRWLMIDLAFLINNNERERSFYNLLNPDEHLVLSGRKFMMDGKVQADHPTYTDKRPHYEVVAPITGLLYLPTRNLIQEGNPLLFDLKQFEKDHPELKPCTIQERRDDKDDGVKTIWNPALPVKYLEPYSLEIQRKAEEVFVVLYKNQGINPIAHAATTPVFPEHADFQRNHLGYNLQPHTYRLKKDDPNWLTWLEEMYSQPD